MLSEPRIKEAEAEVRTYLRDGLVQKVPTPNQLVKNILVTNAQESLRIAGLALEHRGFLWAVVCSYYAMFYIASAVLYKYGYKVGGKVVHKVTADTLIVFVRHKLQKMLVEEYEEALAEALVLIRADDLLTDFDAERQKRSHFQYNTTELAKEAKAKTSLERAKRFYAELLKLLES